VSYWRAKQYELEKQLERGGGDRRSKAVQDQKDQNDPFENTAKKIAKEHQVGEATIKRDAAFTRAVDTVTKAAGPSARATLLTQGHKVTRVAVQRLAQIVASSPKTAQNGFPTASAKFRTLDNIILIDRGLGVSKNTGYCCPTSLLVLPSRI
jgi:hypothetical protein